MEKGIRKKNYIKRCKVKKFLSAFANPEIL